MSDEEKLGFQVIDKRQFDQGGMPRDDASGDSVEKKNQSSSSTEKRVSSEERPSSVNSGSVNTGSVPSGGANASVEDGRPEVDFSGFVLGMMHQAVIMLGEAPHPETGQVVENFEIARQTIEILAMLEEKTKGNLTEEEDRFLRDGVTGLRMAYVAKIREKHSQA